MASATEKDTNVKKQELDSGKELALAAYDNLLEAQGHFRQAAEAAGVDLKQDVLAQLVKGRDKAEALGHDVERFVHDRPLQTLGLAFIAGLLAAQLLSRK